MLRAALVLRPRNAQVNDQLAKLIWQKSKSREAAALLDRATRADPNIAKHSFSRAPCCRRWDGEPKRRARSRG